MRFSFNQRELRDLRQVAHKTFGISSRKRPRLVQFESVLVDGRYWTRATISEAGVTLRYDSPEEQSEAVCFQIELNALRPFESARDSGVLICGDLGSGVASINADVQSRITQQTGVAIMVAEANAAVEPVASKELTTSILDELAAATSIADPNSVRDALRCLSLSGSRKSLEATDGRKALIVNDMDWPWDDDRLVARNGWFASTPVHKATSKVVVAYCGEHVRFTAGPWSIELPCESHRFPDVQRVIPRREETNTTLSLTYEDHAAMETAVKALPRADAGQPQAVTLDLHEEPTLRTSSGTSQSQAVLPRATREGDPLRVALGRHVLADIARLKLGELRFLDAHKPLYGRSANRTYVAMPLHPEFVVLAAQEASSPSTPQQASTAVA